MTTKLQTKGEEWASLAQKYATMTVNPSQPVVQALLDDSNRLSPFSHATAILDNGCGPGPIMTKLLADHSTTIPAGCKLSCADFSEPMIAQARQRQADAAADSRWKDVQISVQDAMDLSNVESGSQSHVLAGLVYFLTGDPQRCLRESRRVLRDNGSGVLATSSWGTVAWLQLTDVIERVFPHVTMPTMPEEWQTPDRVKAEFEKAGFRDVEARNVRTGMPVKSYEEVVDAMLMVPHARQATQGLSEEDKGMLREKMLERARELVPELPGVLPGTAVVAVGRK